MSPRDFYLDENENPTPARPGGGPKRPTEKTSYAPPGTYEVIIDWVKIQESKDGYEKWRFRMVVNKGKYQNRYAAYDSITWKDGNHANRIKMLLKAMGLPHKGRINCVPDAIKNIPFLVTTELGTYFNKEGVQEPNVPYDAFQKLNDKDVAHEVPTSEGGDFDGIPF